MSLEKDFDALLHGYDPAIGELARGARRLIASVRPRAHQEVHPGWGGYLLFKQVAGAGTTVCWLSAHQKHVSIGFSQGASLPDPAGLLAGTGKHQRHVKIKKPVDLERPELRALIAAAWDQQPDPSTLSVALERVRELCLALPEASEKLSHGHPTFFAGKKSFAVYGLYSPSVAFKAPLGLQVELEGDPRFFPTPYMAHRGWLSVRLDNETDWAQVADLLKQSYREVAPAKLRKTLEARG
ncbi:MAG: MmcQ/YjbR family DNA-binding protein [Vulcanimicrobiota bacterium]